MEKIFSRKGMKRMFEKENLKIGGYALNKFMKFETDKLMKAVSIIGRKARILGRKTIKEEDVCQA